MNVVPADRRRELRSRLTCAIAMLLLPFSSGSAAAQNSGHAQDGRLVNMGESDQKVFFKYYAAPHDNTRPVVMSSAEGLLDSMKSPDLLGGQLGLSEVQKQMLGKTTLRSSKTRNVGMSTSYQNRQYVIIVPDEAAFFVAFMAKSIMDSSKNADFGYLNLFIMSEMDWFRNRSARWYDAATYASFKGDDAPPTAEKDMGGYSGMTNLLVMNMLFHEVCHNFQGHTLNGLQEAAKLRRRGRHAKAAALLIENEADADRCAAGLALKAGIPPGITLAATLAVSIVMGDSLNATHPMSRDRIERARLYDERALSSAADRGLFPRDLVQKAGAFSGELLRTFEKYHRLYN